MVRMAFLMCIFPLLLFSQNPVFLRDNLKKAEVGDYAVIAQGKSYTLFHIFNKENHLLTIEEITIPSNLACQQIRSWPAWVWNNAPQNTSWVHYQIDLANNAVKNAYSFTKQKWFTSAEGENFLLTLLQLELQPIPLEYRRKVGSIKRGCDDTRPLWQPKMVVSGQVLEGVAFDGYTTMWPKDGGPLSGKTIEVYFPQEAHLYPAYFPYWLQTKGLMGPAKVRIVDSGKGLISPKAPLY